MRVPFSLIAVLLTCLLFCTDAKEEPEAMPEPWNSLGLEIDGAEILRASEAELSLSFPFIRPEQSRLPYAMILDAMKNKGWKVIEQDYGKEGEMEAPDGTRYGVEVFVDRQKVFANLWRK